ncbi:hypothetical protein [Kingella kingae]|uniref:hypothetical protein n=2 Tax=Kingella kingae TaxID=504 RepID=UPI0002EB38A5|nr:hypothetical protein [Kingella kingae]MDK4669925.1 hypothetical protein [Kingella kingae]
MSSQKAACTFQSHKKDIIMKKYLISLFLLAMQPALADTLAYNGCQYQGEVAQQKPHGKGTLTCRDGRIYSGEFKHGQFHGKGQYIVPNQHSLSIAPFGMNSDKIKGMVLVGTFANDMAHGKFKVYQDGKHLFNFTFERGIAKSMTLAK